MDTTTKTANAVTSNIRAAETLLAEAEVSGAQTARDLTARAHVHALLAVAEATTAQNRRSA